jgi:hypothetical protein
MYHLTLLNYTSDTVSITFKGIFGSYILYPSSNTPFSFKKWKPLSELMIETLVEKALDLNGQPCYLNLKKRRGLIGTRLVWELIRTDLPCTVYRVIVCTSVHFSVE